MPTLTPHNTTLTPLVSAMLAKSSIPRIALEPIRRTEVKSKTTSSSTLSSFSKVSCSAWTMRSSSIFSNTTVIDIFHRPLRVLILKCLGHLRLPSPVISLPKQLGQFAHQWHAGVRSPGRIVESKLRQIGHGALEFFPGDSQVGNRTRELQLVE